MELLLASALVAAASAWGFAALRFPPDRRRALYFPVGVVAAAGLSMAAFSALQRPAPAERDVQGRPIEVQPEGYVTSRACRACHPGAYAAWEASYHRRMTQVATPETVVGDFDGTELRMGEWRYLLERRGDEFWVDMPEIDWSREGPDGPRVRRRIVLTTGSHHAQIYWYETGNTRALGMLPFLYNVKLDRWVPYEASLIRKPRDKPQSALGAWNKGCIECHATQGRLRPTPRGQDTHVAEFGIACEACHGPAAAHVAAHRSMSRRYRAHFSEGPEGDIVQPARLPHDRASEVCGQCHATSIWTSQESIDDWMQNGPRYRPGDTLGDGRGLVRGKAEWNSDEVEAALALQPDDFLLSSFWPDGENRVAGREFNDLFETPCYQRGELSCMSCHRMHKAEDDPRTLEEWADDQLGRGMRGNAACSSCHTGYTEPAALQGHTHHAAGSPGSLCYNCHMPYTTYGLRKAIRNHQIDNPSAATDVLSGRPNACNLCHLDRPLAWTARWLETWYDEPPPALAPEQHAVAQSVLALLRGNAVERALAAWAMGWEPALQASGDDWEAFYLALLQGDPYPAVRTVALRSLRSLPGLEAYDADFMASDEERHEQANALIAGWQREHVIAGGRTGREILVADDGTVLMPEVLALLRQRDDRLLFMAE